MSLVLCTISHVYTGCRNTDMAIVNVFIEKSFYFICFNLRQTGHTTQVLKLLLENSPCLEIIYEDAYYMKTYSWGIKGFDKPLFYVVKLP